MPGPRALAVASLAVASCARTGRCPELHSWNRHLLPRPAAAAPGPLSPVPGLSAARGPGPTLRVPVLRQTSSRAGKAEWQGLFPSICAPPPCLWASLRRSCLIKAQPWGWPSPVPAERCCQARRPHARCLLRPGGSGWELADRGQCGRPAGSYGLASFSPLRQRRAGPGQHGGARLSRGPRWRRGLGLPTRPYSIGGHPRAGSRTHALGGGGPGRLHRGWRRQRQGTSVGRHTRGCQLPYGPLRALGLTVVPVSPSRSWTIL